MDNSQDSDHILGDKNSSEVPWKIGGIEAVMFVGFLPSVIMPLLIPAHIVSLTLLIVIKYFTLKGITVKQFLRYFRVMRSPRVVVPTIRQYWRNRKWFLPWPY